MVVLAGLADTWFPVVALSPVDGCHAYPEAPVALSTPCWPEQRTIDGVTETSGELLTVIAIVLVAVHPLFDAVTVYVVVEGGEAVTALPVVTFNPEPGAHE